MENIKMMKIIVKQVTSELADSLSTKPRRTLGHARTRLNVMYMATTPRAQT